MHGLSTYLRRHHIGLLALFIALGGTSYAAVTLSANGVGGTSQLAQLPAVRVRKASDTQVVPGDGTTATVSFTDPSSEQYDIGNMFDQATNATELIIPVTGTYVITGAVRWQANDNGFRNLNLHGPQPGGLRASSSVHANNTDVPPGGPPGGPPLPPVPDTTRQSVSTTERFNAGDHVFMSVSQTSGVPLFLDASQNQIHLSAAFMGP